MKRNTTLALVSALTLTIAAPSVYGMEYVNRGLESINKNPLFVKAKQNWKPITGTVAAVGIGYWLWSSYTAPSQNNSETKNTEHEAITVHHHHLELKTLINESRVNSNTQEKLKELKEYVESIKDTQLLVRVLKYAHNNLNDLFTIATKTPAQEYITDLYVKHGLAKAPQKIEENITLHPLYGQPEPEIEIEFQPKKVMINIPDQITSPRFTIKIPTSPTDTPSQAIMIKKPELSAEKMIQKLAMETLILIKDSKFIEIKDKFNKLAQDKTTCTLIPDVLKYNNKVLATTAQSNMLTRNTVQELYKQYKIK